MLKTVKAGLLGAAAIGIATAAMAETSDVNVNIEVLETVSMWANDTSVSLVLSGANPENSDTVESSLSVINNVDANISASVASANPNALADQAKFHIHGGNEAALQAAIVENSNNPGAVLANTATWAQGDLGTLSAVLIPSTGVNPNIVPFPVTYGASAPNELPEPDAYDLTVTWTITANP